VAAACNGMKAIRKGKKNTPVPWSQEELKLLKKLYQNTKAREIAEQTGRTIGSLREKARKLGLQKKSFRLWSKKDLGILKKLYPTEKVQVVAEKLGRSIYALHGKAAKLGLKNQNTPVP